MIKINIIGNDEQNYCIETLSEFDDMVFIIKNILKKHDSSLFLKMLSEDLKDYLQSAFSISIKELSKFFKHKVETIIFIETMVKFGYLLKYHTAYKITNTFLEDLSVTPINTNLLSSFTLNENILFNEKLGLNIIQYLLNTNSFQQSTFINITEYSKKESLEILNYLIYKGYITKIGTTYRITEKFKQKASEYQDLFNEIKED